MNHGTVLARAWQLLKQYRALWVFGIILALTTSAGAFSGSNSGYQTDGEEISRTSGINIYADEQGNLQVDWGDTNELQAFFKEDWPAMQQSFENWVEARTSVDLMQMGITVAILFGVALLALIVVSTIARVVSETALIRMVDDYEDSGEQLTVRQGFRLGWSRLAWRVYLINLVIDVPAILAVLLLLACVGAPALLWLTGSTAAGITGTVATIGLFFLAILGIIIAAVILHLIKEFARRLALLEGLGVRAAIRGGWEMVRQYVKDIGLMWLITLAIKVAWPFVMLPVALVGIAIAIFLGGGLGLAVGGISGLFAGSVMRWVIGGTVGVLIGVLVLAVPLLFFGGLREVYLSSAWTLTYRELHLLGELAPETPLGDAPLLDADQAAQAG